MTVHIHLLVVHKLMATVPFDKKHVLVCRVPTKGFDALAKHGPLNGILS